MPATLVALLTPVIQLGASYYASVATLVLLLALVTWRHALGAGFLAALPLLAVVPLMPLPLIGAPSVDPLADRLRIAREAVVLFLLLCGLAGMPAARRPPPAPPEWLLAMLVGFYLVMVAVQTRAYAAGAYVGLPPGWYAQEQGTFADDAALFYMRGILRPHATFSEPSYLGFMLLSIALMLVPRVGRSRLAMATMGMIVTAGLMARSLAFFLAMLLVILLPTLLERGRNRIAIVGGLLALSVPAILLSGDALLSRLSGAGSFDTADFSTAVRIFAPLNALPRYLLAYPLGNPIAIVGGALAPLLDNRTMDPADILNNAFFNLLFSYGVLGFLIFGAIMLAAGDLRTRLYLLTGTMFNGAFLAIDKLAIILFALAVYEHNRRRAEVLDAQAGADAA